LISLSILYQPIHQLLFAGGAMAPSASTSYGDDLGYALEVTRDVVDPAIFAVPITGGMLISLSILYQPFHQRLFSGDGTEPSWASKPYIEPRPNHWIRRDEVDVSIYEVRMTDSGSKLIWLSIQYQSFQQLLFAGSTMAGPSTSTTISAQPISTLPYTSGPGEERAYNLLIV
jgi:hypothetical protein